jgi:hypothetical protein
VNKRIYRIDGANCAEREHVVMLCDKQQLGVVRENEGLGGSECTE